MVLRVKPTPTRSLYPDGQHSLAFHIKCVPPVGQVVVVETWRLRPLEKGFPSKRQHAARVGGKNRERWGLFAEELLSQCYSV